MKELEKIDEAEAAVFKKKLKMLKAFKGKGTELISLYLPPDVDRSLVMSQLTEETSQSSNIKSPTTRKNVQGALRKISNFLKRINFQLPERGLVVFCGNISEQEGRSDITLFTVRPLRRLKVKLYWCDSQFHLDPLEEMAAPSEIYGLATLDKREATFAALVGKKYEVLGRITSAVPGKVKAGGFSAHRYERLREEATHDFFKRIAEKMGAIYLVYGNKMKGIIIGGPGATKNYFLDQDLLDYRLKGMVLGTLDTSYTDESGIRELFQKSEEILKSTEVMKERLAVNNFLQEVVKGALATYGQKEVEQALAEGKVKTLLVSEAIDWVVYRLLCGHCNNSEEILVKNRFGLGTTPKCTKCNAEAEIMEEVDYADWLLEKVHKIDAEMKLISTETAEGEQFYKTFGGLGAILRYK